jgi:HSP20 family protein
LKYREVASYGISVNIFRRQSSMWAEACARLDEAERRHRHFFDLLAAPATRAVWEPPANIFTAGPEVHVIVALPGVRAEEVQVQITATGLQVDAAVAPQALGAGMNILRLEIPYGRMRRRVDLPPGRYALIERRLELGCLHLRLTEATP